MDDPNWKRTERAKTLSTQEFLSTIKVNLSAFLRAMHVNAPVKKNNASRTYVVYGAWSDKHDSWVQAHLPRSKRLTDVPF
jgi:hypothetical protein